MRKIKFNPIKFLILSLILFLFSASIFAIPDILVDLRLYKGARGKESVQPSVVTSYYLKPISSAGKILDSDLSGEKEELKKIFNLVEIKLMTQAKWAWKKEITKKQFELIVLNGRKFIVQLTHLKKKDHFRLEVLEEGKEKEKENLQTVLIIPQGKTSVFGFEDSTGRPYFLSCQRHRDKEGDAEEPLMVPPLKRPLLIKKVKPVYHEAALRAQVSGKVIAEVVSDVYGRIVDITKIEGHPLLNDATLEAVKQWVYEPFLLDGRPKRVKFTVVVTFSLNKKGEEGRVTVDPPVKESTLEKKPVLVKKVAPKYPEDAVKANISGKVVVEAVTDREGNVKEILKVTGPPVLTGPAVEAVKQWKYKPYIVNGEAKAVEFTTIVKFELNRTKEHLRNKEGKKKKAADKK